MATRILLIDDDEDDYIITREIIEEIKIREYIIDWIDNYQEAKSEILKNAHDVYLVDYRLGAKDGLQIIEESVVEGVNGPFILLTGQGDIETDERAMKAGAFDYLVKGSFNAFELERSIRYSIEHINYIKEIQKLNVELEERVEERTSALEETVGALEKTNKKLKDQIRVRKLAEEALRESQYLYSTISHNFPNGAINVFNRSLDYVFIDGKELTKLNLVSEELIGKPFTVFFGEDSTQTTEYIKEQFLRTFNGEMLTFEMKVRENHYFLHCAPLPDANEDISQILVVAENITDRKKAEEEVRKALEKEKELNELKSRFVTMASHEFKTPLSTILSSSSLIAKYQDESGQPKREKHVERIKTNVNQLNRLLNDFLTIGKLEEGKTINVPVMFDVVKLGRAVTEEMQLQAKEEQTVQFNVDGEPREVYLDESLIKNVLNNLLSNAIKYSPNGKDVYLNFIFKEDSFTLEVIDNGIGIPENEQVHLFERFFRAKNTTNIQGTGLGLNIVRKYVELVGGTIDIKSKLNVGTTIWITIKTNNKA
ncbi:sensor histidine kinase [Chondrinema litorale]|uniref:sensor histidine kinase n=1 Tax=Chondrinema litorale TaxID=2994555 RepID=UPI002543F73E|nr:ATP-binding protein [Chondrinema litorale]UZR93352.1 ATP-binding protein [Chondrinema litorale]